MKTLLLILTLCFCLLSSGMALSSSPVAVAQAPQGEAVMNKIFIERQPPQAQQFEAPKLPPLPRPDPISRKKVKLNSKEKAALGMATEWTDREVKPVMHDNGKVVFVFGATMPSIVCAPLKTSDLQLQPGEQVNDVIVGDTARWVVTVGRSGSGPQESTHLVFKPLDAGLETTAVITTDRRTYHIKLVSDREKHTPFVGFLYPEDQQQALRKQLAAQKRDEKWKTTEIAGQTVRLSALDFSYRVTGEAPWRPLQVYNDGTRTVIRLPESVQQTDMPVLLVENAGEQGLVNYRVRGTSLVVDGVFRKGLLISGVGKKQEKVEIERMVQE